MKPKSALPPYPVAIDALNLAWWCGSPPSLRIPLSLLAPLSAAGHPAVLYFDASARYRLAHEIAIYEQLMRHPRHAVEVPSGKTADAALLGYARSTGACIVSRDRYRDHRKRYRRLIDGPGRLLPGCVEDQRLLVPGLALDVPLCSSPEEAWRLYRDACPMRI